jgi:hypothetical protein
MLRQSPQNRRCFQHFALLYIDRDGQLCHETSPSISVDSVTTVLSPQVISKFLKAVAESEGGSYAARAPVLDHRPRILPASFAPRVPNVGEQGPTFQRQGELWNEEHSSAIQTTTPPAIDKGLLRRYYEQAFETLQQTNCRVVAKAWVKMIEPRKKLQFPYNGRKIVEGKTIQFSPEETKPPWWPPGVRHREPDHLPKTGKKIVFICR